MSTDYFNIEDHHTSFWLYSGSKAVGRRPPSTMSTRPDSGFITAIVSTRIRWAWNTGATAIFQVVLVQKF
jgi:hypothetical protein